MSLVSRLRIDFRMYRHLSIIHSSCLIPITYGIIFSDFLEKMWSEFYMRKNNYLFLAITLVLMAVLFYVNGLSPATIDPKTYHPVVYSTIGALLPPVIAIALALITKEVYSSLFVGIAIGALLYADGNLELALNTMLFNEDGGMITKLADSWNVGIIVFLVILGIFFCV